MGSLERYAKREAEWWIGGLLKILFVLLLLFWPLAVITGEAFGPHPGVLAWLLGLAANLLWLIVLIAGYRSHQASRTAHGGRAGVATGRSRRLAAPSSTLVYSRPAAKPKRPAQEMATVNGVTHRLRWVVRTEGHYQMGCRCGWVDVQMSATDCDAIDSGNRHVRGVLRGTGGQ